MPEVGLAGLPLDYPHSGSAVYTRNLARHLPEAAPDLSFRLFLRWADAPVGCRRVRRVQTPFAPINRGRGVGARIDKLAWEVAALPAAAALDRVELLHYPYLAAPVAASAPLVVTVHDLIPLVLPGYHRNRQSALYSWFMGRVVRRAAAILTVSEHSRVDILRVLRVPEKRVIVIPEAADERFTPRRDPLAESRVRERYALPDRFVLYAGSAEKRKNLETLVRAWSMRATEFRGLDCKLVIVARFPPPDPLYPDVPGLARRLGGEREVLFVPGVDEADKPALYRCATVFCFPSQYEGFGLPPLEAMASGLPVIASDATSLPEVVGDAGVLLPPTDVAAWADAIRALVDSESRRAALRERGLRRAAGFSWRQTASATAEVYRRVLSR
jgi:glycosyltransferase involved in cell wall biosynthesis